jgi:hypothetical protein
VANGHNGWKRPEPRTGKLPPGAGVVGTCVPGGVVAAEAEGTGVAGDRDGEDVPGAADGDPDAVGGPPELPHAVSISPVTAVAAKSRNGSQMFMSAP